MSDSIKRIRFEVNDSGIGITNEDQGKLFKFFGKVGANQEDINPTGIGLGLTICQKILTQFSSELHVTSVFGQGSTFFFNIDLKVSTSSNQRRSFRNNLVSSENLSLLSHSEIIAQVPETNGYYINGRFQNYKNASDQR